MKEDWVLLDFFSEECSNSVFLHIAVMKLCAVHLCVVDNIVVHYRVLLIAVSNACLTP